MAILSNAEHTARVIRDGVLVELGAALYQGDAGLVTVGSRLIEIDRGLPQLDRDEPKRAEALRLALPLIEARLARRFGIDPARARAAALRHAGVA